MEQLSIFDVIGPNMIGPSSSHTAGAALIGRMAREMFSEPVSSVEFILYGSFAKTFRGHGTDKALLGGILGFETDDVRIKNSFILAEKMGLQYRFTIDEETQTDYPNTVDILLSGDSGRQMSVRGESVGGGKVKITRINGIRIEFTGEYSTLLVKQEDRPGVIAFITSCLAGQNVNIAFMRLFREQKGFYAYTVVESDGKLPQSILEEIRKNSSIEEILLIQF